MERWTVVQIYKWTYGKKKKWTEVQMDRRTDGFTIIINTIGTDGETLTDGQMDKWIYEQMNRLTDGQMEQWKKGQINRQMYILIPQPSM